jgi:hypothetical protein
MASGTTGSSSDSAQTGGSMIQVAPNVLSVRQKYAWDWFSYHAAQRMTSLNYFFVTVGIFAVAYSKCAEHGWRGFGCLIGGLGAMSSLAFWFLDVRNEELVNCGREALKKVEEELQMSLRTNDYDRVFLDVSMGWFSGLLFEILKVPFPESKKNVIGSAERRKFWAGDIFAHRFWLRTLHLGAFAVFAGGAFFAWMGYPPLETWRFWHCIYG